MGTKQNNTRQETWERSEIVCVVACVPSREKTRSLKKKKKTCLVIAKLLKPHSQSAVQYATKLFQIVKRALKQLVQARHGAAHAASALCHLHLLLLSSCFFVCCSDRRTAMVDEDGGREDEDQVSEQEQKIGLLAGFCWLDFAGFDSLRRNSKFARHISD